MSKPDGLDGLCDGGWATFHAQLTDVLRGMLWQNAFSYDMFNLELATPSREDLPEPPSRLRWWLRGRRGRTGAPWLSFMRADECLYLTFSGPVEDGGWVILSPRQRAGLEALGWKQSQRSRRDRKRWSWPHYCAYFPVGPGGVGDPSNLPRGLYEEMVDFGAAAHLAVDTLRGPLGAQAPEDLRVM